MDINEEIRTSLYKNTIKYLYDISEKVPISSNVLKSYYSAKFRISELQTQLYLDKRTKSKKRCPKCCLQVKDATASYHLKPEEKPSKFARQLVRKADQGRKLTQFQKKYLKKIDLEAKNELVITCNFCRNEAKYKCAKPKKVRVINETSKKKKKKKKKDQFCGLRIEAVESAKKESSVINKTISKKKAKKKLVKSRMKLNEMLNLKSNVKDKKKNNLSQFLQSL